MVQGEIIVCVKVSIVKRNLVTIGKAWFIFMGSIFSLLSVILSFVSWEDVGINKTCNKIIIFVKYCVDEFVNIWIYFTLKQAILDFISYI